MELDSGNYKLLFNSNTVQLFEDNKIKGQVDISFMCKVFLEHLNEHLTNEKVEYSI